MAVREWWKSCNRSADGVLLFYTDPRELSAAEVCKLLDGGAIDLLVAKNPPTSRRGTGNGNGDRSGASADDGGRNERLAGMSTDEERKGAVKEEPQEEFSELFIELIRVLGTIEPLQLARSV